MYNRSSAIMPVRKKTPVWSQPSERPSRLFEPTFLPEDSQLPSTNISEFFWSKTAVYRCHSPVPRVLPRAWCLGESVPPLFS